MFSMKQCDLNKFKQKTQLKALSHIVGEKQVGIKDAIKIISLLNAFQKLFVSQVLKLIFTVTATKAVTGRSCSTLRRVETYL